MKIFKKITFSIGYIIILTFAIECSYRIFRAIQFRNVDILIYPLSVNYDDKSNKFSGVIDFKEKKIKKDNLSYIVRCRYISTRLLKYTDLQYKNQFGEAEIRVTGFNNFAAPKKNNEIRVLTLGGSSTYGDGVNDDQTYPVYLQRELAPFYKNLEITVINGGFRGKTIAETKELLRFLLLDFSPDILVFYEGHNDVQLPNSLYIQDTVFINEKVYEKLHIPEKISLAFWDIFESNMDFFINSKKSIYLNNLACANKEEARTLKDYFDKRIKGFQNSAEELIQIAENRGIFLILSNQLIWIDSLPLVKDPTIIERLNKRLTGSPQNLKAVEGFYLMHEKFMKVLKKSANEKKGIYWLNIYPKFRGVKPSEVLMDRVHLTVEGNKIVARAMAEFIYTNKLIEKTAQLRGIRVIDKKKDCQIGRFLGKSQ